MSERQQSTAPPPVQPNGRPVGGTEYSFCRALPGGTGITVLALLLSKPPNFPLLQTALHKLQIAHPILRSHLHFNSSTHAFSFSTPSTPGLQIQPFDLPSTAAVLTTPSSVSPFHQILEHELNQNPWRVPEPTIDVFFARVYTLSEGQWVLVLRLHTAACDRTTAASLLRELMGLIGEGVEREIEGKCDVGLEIEECVPKGKGKKPFWARGKDMIGYSLNSFRFSHLDFKDLGLPRSSWVVRLKMSKEETDRIVLGCKSRGIGLCGALAAAGLIAGRSSKSLPDDHREKYAVVTLLDCRSILDPVLTSHDLGFYHTAIINSHDIRGGEKLWDLAKRTYMSFANSKENNKHFSDMADINFLSLKAIENPGLTASGASRTSFVSVFEDPVIDRSNEVVHEVIGLQDYIGCASVHGIGPSMAVFDTIRDGELDCACVYPSPLHSREQMQQLVDEMKRILVDACSSG